MRKVTPPKTKELPKTFGGRVMHLRKASGQSQDELAAILDISRNYLNMIENGKRIPNIDALETLAKHFDVTSDFLLCISNLPRGNADDMTIEKKLGLSNDAINNLEMIRLEDGTSYFDDVLNGFIGHKHFLNLLNVIDDLFKLIAVNNIRKKGKTKDELRDEEESLRKAAIIHLTQFDSNLAPYVASPSESINSKRFLASRIADEIIDQILVTQAPKFVEYLVSLNSDEEANQNGKHPQN